MEFTNNVFREINYDEYELHNETSNFDDFTFNDLTQFEQNDFDPKFRSMHIVDSHALSSLGPQSIYTKFEPVQGPPSLRKDHAQMHDITISKSENFQIQVETQNITVPDKPFYFGPTYFITTLCLTELVSRIDQQLAMFFEASYNFFPDHCRVIFF